MELFHSNCHYISATAKLPEDFPSGEVYKHLDVGLIINLDNLEIVDGSITLLTPTSQRFILGKLVGQKLTEDGFKLLEAELIRTYHGTALKALLYALGLIYDKLKTLEKVKEII